MKKKINIILILCLFIATNIFSQDTLYINISKKNESIVLDSFYNYLRIKKMDSLMSDKYLIKVIYTLDVKEEIKNYSCEENIELYFDLRPIDAYYIFVLDTVLKKTPLVLSMSRDTTKRWYFYYYSWKNYGSLNDYEFFYKNIYNFIFSFSYFSLRDLNLFIERNQLYIYDDFTERLLPANKYMQKYPKLRRYIRYSDNFKKYDYCFFKKMFKKNNKIVYMSVNYY